ncbi:hypothetical protein IVB27_26620 [Bradyrhizobium sp. 197]|uniref:hypothetical protein n=1 Tax=Bradyrhizobium sp. 197 TaxID=2782663 RepID=UPI001FF8D30E|nr:hypothetical protein [Bradyrhizobium sp. 197]MCK1478278.1 hypothetical protein [Bradyrhizobium sp. 197]
MNAFTFQRIAPSDARFGSGAVTLDRAGDVCSRPTTDTGAAGARAWLANAKLTEEVTGLSGAFSLAEVAGMVEESEDAARAVG